jgi:glycosyltransferase involved in cell wall biosynthesis
MKLQVVASVMNQSDYSLIDKMNIKTDAIFINQCDKFELGRIRKKGKTIDFYSLPEKGVGLSRNTGLMRANADVVLLADDDVEYDNDYEQKVLEAFSRNPGADMLFFNLPSQNPDRPEYIITKFGRVRWYNSLRYGAFRIAIRTESFKRCGVNFSLQFGGGARYSSGEDSLFIYNCLAKGMKAYAVPETIGTVRQEESTWFDGYTDSFFLDKGSLFAAISSRWGRAFAVYYILRNYKTFDGSRNRRKLISLVIDGFNRYEK